MSSTRKRDESMNRVNKSRANPNSMMNVLTHLDELRRRIIYSAIWFMVAALLGFALVSHLYHYLCSPLAASHVSLIAVSPGEIVGVFLSIAAGIAVGLTLPFGLWQIWAFVAPGLTARERHFTLRIIPIVVVMFIIGVCFSWSFIFPTILHFLIALNRQQGLVVMLRASSYFRFLNSIVLPFGFVFELPMVVVVLTRLGIVTPRFLRKNRRYAYLAIVCLGVLISPPELVSHLSVTVPMMILYELSTLLSVVVDRKRRNPIAGNLSTYQAGGRA